VSYERSLRVSLDAALEAGELLRREFHRWGGPRGYRDHADADTEAEWMIRNRLMSEFPHYRYLGEETGSIDSQDEHVWLVDPNDGTSSYLRGARGSSVSIGLVRNGIPVLGVVYAYTAPDDAGDLIYWAEGFELTRNGKPVRPQWKTNPRNHVVVLVSTHRESLIETLLEVIHPFRYRAFSSIAYRLALVAVGDGDAALSWHGPCGWDYAAGHALIRAAGGIFVNENGEEVTYDANGLSNVNICFGGHPGLTKDLSHRNFSQVQSRFFSKAESYSDSPFLFSRLQPGRAVPSDEMLARAHGCMIGQVVGDALGSQVEFLDPGTIRSRYPDGVRHMEDGGTHNTLAGQPTDDSELALLLARSIVQEKKYDPEKTAAAYSYWYSQSRPFDVGSTTSKAMSAVTDSDLSANKAAATMRENASKSSQANGSLMRISPLAIYAYRKSADDLWRMAEVESSLTHPHAVCTQCCGLYCHAIVNAIAGRSPQRIYESTLAVAERRCVEPSVMQSLQASAIEAPGAMKNIGWVLVAFQNAFYQLLHSNTFEDSVVNTVALGGDTDTNAAIAGALLGAVHGREAIPSEWRRLVLSCRPSATAGAAHPRPWCFWPVDLTNLAERLLLAG